MSPINIPAKKMGVLCFVFCVLLFSSLSFSENRKGAEKCNKDDSGEKADSPGTELSIIFSV